ncbi:MAG: hypothetical protein ACOY0T_20725 [Myxococcota bacterium]
MKLTRRISGICAVLLSGAGLSSGCSSSAGPEETGNLGQALTCDLGLTTALSGACSKANSEASITASALSNPNPAQIVADSSAYGVRLINVGGSYQGALRFVPLQTTSYNIYLGSPNLPFRVVGPGGQVVAPSCSSTLTSTECNKLRRVNTYQLVAGETYRLEVQPTTAASWVRLFIQTRLEPVATCDADDLTRLSVACTDAEAGSTKITASNGGVGTPVSLNTVYNITLPTVGTNTYAGTFSFSPAVSGDYELLLGTPKIPVAVAVGASPVNPDCSRLVSSAECKLLRRGDRLTLEGGVTYSFTLGPNVNTQFVRATIRRSVEDECALGTDNCDHDPNACVDADEGFSCVCPTGYVGTGVGDDGCAPEAVNECALNTDNCDDAPEACVDTPEGFNCVCPEGFIGDGIGAEGCQPAGVTSSQTPYVIPVAEGVEIKAILTVGDSPNLKPSGEPYRMVGIPDGLGAFDNGDGTFTLLSNHELTAAAGIPRAHGGTGAFVSRWQIRKSDLRVLHGEDLIQQVQLFSGGVYTPTTGVAMSRFCSADLPAPSAFYNASTGLGFDGRLFLNGEESGAEGRGFAHGLDGTSWELPRIGKMAFENSLASPAQSDKTVVISTDDGTGGQVYVYVGDKTASGSPVERAGLTNGTLYGIRVVGVPVEDPATGIATGAFELADLGNVENQTGAALDAASVAAGVTSFQRPEDGLWDPSNPNDFYFVTTASFTSNSRLWRLRFNDATNPALGGTIEMLLDGSEGHRMLDNLGIDSSGHIMAVEDVGNQPHLGRVLRYDIASDTLSVVATADPARFTSGSPGFLTQDEEASGIIDASSLLGPGWWLLDMQAHYSLGGELVEDGQYLALYDPATAG